MAAPILIYRLGSLGDTVVALPCFHRIAQTFSDRKRLVLTNVPVSSKAAALDLILGPSGLIDGIIDYQLGLRSVPEISALARRIRAAGADTMIYLTAPRGSAAVLRDLLFFRFCGLRNIIGAPLGRDLRSRVKAQNGEIEPEAERLARTLAPLGAIDLTDPAQWDLQLTADELAAGRKALLPTGDCPVLAINIGGKAARNDWGDDAWTSLIESLTTTLPNYALALIGSPEDYARSSELAKRWSGPTVNMCGLLTPRESAAALRQAQLFVGHDSGPMHLAASVGTVTIGLFGDNNMPRLWHPYGSGNVALHDMRGVRAISVGRVRDAVLSVVAR